MADVGLLDRDGERRTTPPDFTDDDACPGTPCRDDPLDHGPDIANRNPCDGYEQIAVLQTNAQRSGIAQENPRRPGPLSGYRDPSWPDSRIGEPQNLCCAHEDPLWRRPVATRRFGSTRGSRERTRGLGARRLCQDSKTRRWRVERTPRSVAPLLDLSVENGGAGSERSPHSRPNRLGSPPPDWQHSKQRDSEDQPVGTGTTQHSESLARIELVRSELLRRHGQIGLEHDQFA